MQVESGWNKISANENLFSCWDVGVTKNFLYVEE